MLSAAAVGLLFVIAFATVRPIRYVYFDCHRTKADTVRLIENDSFRLAMLETSCALTRENSVLPVE